MNQSDDLISRRNALEDFCSTCDRWDCDIKTCAKARWLRELPSVQPKYEPVTAEDFAKVMSESTIYGFMAWYGEVLALMKRMGFVICKKT